MCGAGEGGGWSWLLHPPGDQVEEGGYHDAAVDGQPQQDDDDVPPAQREKTMFIP